ncbi:MAG: polyprenyl synthetase family protein [Planctomycetes bacterium]|nr:polyprenyl synthetase family protein [Planctomycetota bacterium]
MRQPSVFETYRDEVDAELRAVFEGYSSPLYDMLRYHLGWMTQEGEAGNGSAGKGLRSTLCLLACESLGADRRPALPAAATIDLVHNYSLIHDDIQDGDVERRHRPTVWAIWGEAQAINAGSAMRQLADVALRRLVDRGVSTEKALRASWLLDDTCLRLLEGQWLDINFEERLDVGVADYVEMISLKTGALLSFAARLGALIAVDDEAAVDAFGRFGLNLGIAFQIRDDVLGIWGDESQTGKPLGNDIRRKKKSFPVIYALQNSPDASELRRIYSLPEIAGDDLAAVMGILEGVRAEEAAGCIARRYRDQALREIAPLSLSARGWADLKEIACFLVERSH